MPDLPASPRFVVVGAGIHGLSTAYHLAKELRTRGTGSGADVVVLEKSEPGAGASGIACGVVRNNYFQPAMSELMQACVEVWESDPAAYAYNPVGYMALGPEVQESDLAATFERQEKIGYRSTFVTGAGEVDAYMKRVFPDWRAQGVTALLHEHQGGFAFNRESVLGLAGKCAEEGVEVVERRRGAGDRPGRRRHRDRARDESRPDRGRRAARHRARPVGEALLVAARAARDRSTCAPRPARSSTTSPCGRTGTSRRARSAWTRYVRDRGRERSAGHPSRHRRAARGRRRRADHRRALGHLLQARPPRRAGRRLAAGRRRRGRARPVPVHHGRRRRASRTCGAPRSRTR